MFGARRHQPRRGVRQRCGGRSRYRRQSIVARCGSGGGVTGVVEEETASACVGTMRRQGSNVNVRRRSDGVDEALLDEKEEGRCAVVRPNVETVACVEADKYGQFSMERESPIHEQQ